MEQPSSITLRYRKNGALYAFTAAEGTVETEHLRMTIETDEERLRIRIESTEEIVLEKLEAVYPVSYTGEERIFLNGYQSWTDSTEHSIKEKMRGVSHIPRALRERYAFAQYGDYTFTEYPDKAGALHGWTYGYIRRGHRYLLFGSLNEQSGFTCIRTDAEKQTLTFEKDCAGLHLQGVLEMQLLFASGTEHEVFSAYFEALSLPPVKAKPIFGYTSWYRHYQDISEQKILSDLRGMQHMPYKADVFQIDDGWQTAVGDWLSVDAAKFPHGMEQIAGQIRSAGYRAGLWLAPFVCEKNSAVYREHADWLVRDESGEPVRGGANWSGFYALDFYNEDFRAYLREVFDTVVREWGFSLLKLDFLYGVCIMPRADKTRGQIMSEAMDFLRECAGDAQILGCGVPLGAAFGKVDYCRIGCDVSLDWDDKPYMRMMHRERVSTKHSLLNSVFRRQLDGRAFLCDPDVFLLREDNISMTAEQKRCLAEINALTGSVLFTSDDCADYGEKQLKTLRNLMSMRNAEIQFVSYTGGLLTVTFAIHGREFTHKYRV